MTTQEKNMEAARKMPQKQDAQAQDGQGGEHNGEADEHSRLGHVLGRAGTAVGDSLAGLTRRGDGDGNESGDSSSGAPKAATAAALSAVAALAGRRLLERPRRRVAGVPVPGTRRPRRSVAKDLARRLPGMG